MPVFLVKQGLEQIPTDGLKRILNTNTMCLDGFYWDPLRGVP